MSDKPKPGSLCCVIDPEFGSYDVSLYKTSSAAKKDPGRIGRLGMSEFICIVYADDPVMVLEVHPNNLYKVIYKDLVGWLRGILSPWDQQDESSSCQRETLSPET